MDKKLKLHGDELREQIYQFIVNYVDNVGYAPTIREIGKAVGLKSSSSVHSHLTQLENERRIKTKSYRPRGIEIVDKYKNAADALNGFWDRVDAEIRQQNKTKHEVAEKCGFEANALIEHRNMPISYLKQLCEVLNISADYLLYGNEWELEEC